MTLTRRGSIAVLVLAAVAGLPAAQHSEAQVQGEVRDQVVATLGGTPITLADLEDAWQKNDSSSRIRLLQELYDTRRRALDILIGERLIEREAKARGLTRQQLLERELPSRTKPVTDAEADEIYERNKQAFGGRTKEQMRPEIRSALTQQRPLQALHTFMEELRMRAADVDILLDPPRLQIETLADDPARGARGAPIEIVEFSDFQCPFCQRAFGTLKDLQKQYGDRIRLVYKDFPLTSHPQAFKAAEAANCAYEQGRFWEYHDKLFTNPQALFVPDLKRHAADLGFNTEAFDTCLDESRFGASVQNDLRIGEKYGVSSTPTLFINGRPVLGAAPLEVFQQLIEEELKNASRRRR